MSCDTTHAQTTYCLVTQPNTTVTSLVGQLDYLYRVAIWISVVIITQITAHITYVQSRHSNIFVRLKIPLRFI